MSLEITGVLEKKNPTQVVSDKFKKREFIVALNEDVNGKTYTNFAKMQLVQQKCDILDKFNEGDTIKVNFNIKGMSWEKDGKTQYITNLDAWRVEAVDNPSTGYTPQNNSGGNVGSGEVDDGSNLPF
jgi:Domain of unknown function (DUF3127)